MSGQAFQGQLFVRNERRDALQRGWYPEFFDTGSIPENSRANLFHTVGDQQSGEAGTLFRFGGNCLEAGNGAAEAEDTHSVAVSVGREDTGALVIDLGKRLVVFRRIPDFIARRNFSVWEASLDHGDGTTRLFIARFGHDGRGAGADTRHAAGGDGRDKGVGTLPCHVFVCGIFG